MVIMLNYRILLDLYDYDADTGYCYCKSSKIRVDTVYTDRYRCIFYDSKRYRVHIFAWLYMTGEIPNKCVDHINGIGSDNQWTNLRLATKQQNCFNRKINKNNTTGYKGVTNTNGRWRAHIRYNGKLKSLGTFDTPEEAANAYDRASSLLFREFSNPNSIQH